jgi:hypothetical protein
MKTISVQVGTRTFQLERSDPVSVIGDEELDHHLYHLGSVCWRFFSSYIDQLSKKILDGTLKSNSIYSEALEDVRTLVEKPDIADTLSRYEVLFQYRRLMRLVNQIDWSGAEYLEPGSVTRDLVSRVDTYFNQARTDQHFVFLNVLQSKRVPKQLIDLLDAPRVVAVTAKKRRLTTEPALGVELTVYTAIEGSDDDLGQIDSVFLLRQGLDGYQGMPLEQHL